MNRDPKGAERHDGYKKPFELLDERWELSDGQEERRLTLEQDIAKRWPSLRFAVTPARKLLRRGELYVPAENEVFGVGYENGPLLMSMREVIEGRCRGCNRLATTGAVLWVGAQSEWQGMLKASGREAIQPFDLTSESIRKEIAAIDTWASEVGVADWNATEAEGYEVVFEAGRVASRSGRRHPSATDARIPKWDWKQPANAIRSP